MATGVNVKMGVSGVSQFKNAMNQAKQATKTLDAQLALTEKEFKATGDAQGYMQKKTEELKAKLENQKMVVDNAQKALESMAANGIDRSSTAYQKLYQEMLKAKGEMLDTQSAMDGITNATDDASDGVSEMNSQLKHIGDGISYQNVTDGISKITGGLEAAARKAVELGKAIVSEVLGAGNWADDLGTRAKYYGISEEELQRMEKTAALIDTPVQAILDAKKRLKKERAKEGKETMGAFEALGIDPKDTKDSDDLFWKTGEALMKLGDEYDKEAYAQTLFGRSWNELIPLFEEGREKYEELNESWSVVPEENVKNLQEMDDQYQILTKEFDTLKKLFLSELAPSMTSVMTSLSDVVKNITAYLKTPEGQQKLEQLETTITDLMNSLLNIDPETVVNGFVSVVDGITDAFKWISDNKDTVIKAMEAIAIGWAGLKITGGALNILKIVEGLKFVKNNPNIPLPGTSGGGAASSAAGGAASGGFWAGVGNKIAAAAGGVGGAEVAAGIGFAAYSAIAILGLAAWADLDKKRAEENEEAQKKAEELAEKTEELQGKLTPEQQATWDLVVGPTQDKGGSNADFYNELIERRKTWLGGDDDPILDTLAEVLDDETWQQLMEILDTFQAGGQIYNPEDVKENYQRMLEEVEQSLGTDTQQSNSEMTEAAKGMKGLPAQVAGAVAAALNNTQVVINGEQLTHVVGVVQASDILANFSVP